jgi:hypothetical protein
MTIIHKSPMRSLRTDKSSNVAQGPENYRDSRGQLLRQANALIHEGARDWSQILDGNRCATTPRQHPRLFIRLSRSLKLYGLRV